MRSKCSLDQPSHPKHALEAPALCYLPASCLCLRIFTGSSWQQAATFHQCSLVADDATDDAESNDIHTRLLSAAARATLICGRLDTRIYAQSPP